MDVRCDTADEGQRSQRFRGYVPLNLSFPIVFRPLFWMVGPSNASFFVARDDCGWPAYHGERGGASGTMNNVATFPNPNQFDCCISGCIGLVLSNRFPAFTERCKYSGQPPSVQLVSSPITLPCTALPTNPPPPTCEVPGVWTHAPEQSMWDGKLFFSH